VLRNDHESAGQNRFRRVRQQPRDTLAVVYPDGTTAGLDAAPPDPPRLRPVGTGLLAVAWAVATALLLVRPAGVPAWRVLWAEDGSRFLSGALDHPGPATWLEPYAGYLHLLPRLVGDVAARLPLAAAAPAFAVASAVVAGGSLVLFAAGLRRWLPAPWQRAGLVVALAATHALAGEAAANAANLHWFLTLGLLGLALSRPRHLPVTAAAAAAVLFALSDPFAPLVAPVALAAAAAGTSGAVRERRTWVVPLAIVAGAAAQVVTMIRTPRAPAPGAPLPGGDLVPLYLDRVVRHGVSPRALGPVPDDALLVALLAGTAVLLGLTLTAARHVVPGAALLAASPAVFVLNVTVNRGVADRYAALPVALLVAGVLVLAAGVPGAGRRLCGLTCAGVVLLGCLSFSTHPPRAAGPDFAESARRAAATCAAGGRTVAVAIAPSPWTTALPCARLRPGSVQAIP
jgi:hypothetical protein